VHDLKFQNQSHRAVVDHCDLRMCLKLAVGNFDSGGAQPRRELSVKSLNANPAFRDSLNDGAHAEIN
jgi:hypothetical protein